MELGGKITAERIAYLKFPISGKITAINCRIGDLVKKGRLLATLEKIELQAYLDRALKEYDLERAIFDEKQKENLTEYEKRKYQDSLDIAVKNVEIAKANLEATDLNSSIDGIVTAIDQANPGDNITPAGFVISVIDPQSFYFEAELNEENLMQVSINQLAKVTLKAFPEKSLEGKVREISQIPLKETQSRTSYSVFVSISYFPELKFGLTGTATFS